MLSLNIPPRPCTCELCQKALKMEVGVADTTRTFETGAMRNADTGKLDFEGFLSPLVLERLATYMHKHRHLSDGKLRDSDNWQAGIPLTVYMKSLWRHFFDVWKEHRKIATNEGLEDALCAVLFNAQGYLHEVLKARGQGNDIATKEGK